MSFNGSILFVLLTVLFNWQPDRKTDGAYDVRLEETACEPTRRMRCHYRLVEVAAGKAAADLRRFQLLFYQGADLSEAREDAISRLDRLFNVRRALSMKPGLENIGRVGDESPVRLRIQGSAYEFSRQDGMKIVVDIAKTTKR